jgi:hypothetical protein
MSDDREHDPGPGHEDEPEPMEEGGTGPGVTPGDVETPGAATTANEPEDDEEESGGSS